MDFSFAQETEALRTDIRAFLDSRLTGELRQEISVAGTGEEASHGPLFRAFYKEVFERGWVAAAWPEAYGGQDRDAEFQYVIEEEFWRQGLRIGGAGTAAAQILQHGTEAQRLHYIARIIRREYRFAPALTEPEAGTDLAAVSCRAERTAAGSYRLSGEKVYISGVPTATHLLVIARTSKELKRGRGLSVFLVEKGLPGLTTQGMATVQTDPPAPAGSIFGQGRFDRIVFDDVDVPGDCLLGAENDGWRVIANSSPYERANPRTWISAVARTEEFGGRLAARPECASRDERIAFGRLWAEGQATRLFGMRCLSLGRGGAGGGETAMEGVWSAEYAIRAIEAIAELEGAAAQLLDGTGIGDGGLLAHSLLGAPQTATHHGGTRALRDQIAARCLDLVEQR